MYKFDWYQNWNGKSSLYSLEMKCSPRLFWWSNLTMKWAHLPMMLGLATQRLTTCKDWLAQKDISTELHVLCSIMSDTFEHARLPVACQPCWYKATLWTTIWSVCKYKVTLWMQFDSSHGSSFCCGSAQCRPSKPRQRARWTESNAYGPWCISTGVLKNCFTALNQRTGSWYILCSQTAIPLAQSNSLWQENFLVCFFLFKFLIKSSYCI